MRILFMGNNVRGVKCLRALLSQGKQIVGVIAHHESGDPVGGASADESVAKVAVQHELDLLCPERVNSAPTRAWIRERDPELGVLAGYNQILRPTTFEIPRLGCINLHGGKLPEYRGVAPINWQLINGETTGGCTILYVDEGIDTGDILAEERFTIDEKDDAATVLERTLEIFPSMLLSVVTAIENDNIRATKQDFEAGCYYTRRFERDGHIAWATSTAVQVRNLVRAIVAPYPGAFCFVDGTKVVINKVSLMSDRVVGVPGRVVLFRGDSAVVTAADRALLVESVSVAGEAVTPRSVFSRLGLDLD